MAWQDLIKDGTYTAPSGKEYSFKYSSGLSSETDLKTATFTFPEKDGALVTPLGYGGRKFPMTCKFYGEDCIVDADAFEEALKERGYGELQHPVYGVHKVVPTGSIKRSDDVVMGLNESTIDVVFSETLVDETFPDSNVLSQDLIESGLDSFVTAAAAEFAADMSPENVAETISVQGTLKSIVRSIDDGISVLAKESTSTYTQFQEIQSGLSSSISRLVDDPIAVAEQILFLSKAPSRLCINVSAKIEGYASVIKSLINNFKKDAFGINAAKNQFISTRLAVQGLMISLASGVAVAMTASGEIDSPASESATSVSTYESNPGTFKSREDAIVAANAILELYDDVVAFLDAKTDLDLIVETGEGFGYMRDVVITSVQMIVDQSFRLSTRRIITLGCDRQIVELLYELYGNLDRIDEFIIDNHLNYNEIALLPMGREVAYYV